MTYTKDRYFWFKFFGPVELSVRETGGDWVKLWTGFRVWRFMLAYILISPTTGQGKESK